jgi:hypothetical protein
MPFHVTKNLVNAHETQPTDFVESNCKTLLGRLVVSLFDKVFYVPGVTCAKKDLFKVPDS